MGMFFGVLSIITPFFFVSLYYSFVTLIRLVHTKVPGRSRPSSNHRLLSSPQVLNLDA